MILGPKTFIGIGLALLLALAAFFALSPRTAPPLVHVPAEQLIGRAGGDDVVHALQDIVETRGEAGLAYSAALAGSSLGGRDLEREARELLTRLEQSAVSPLAQLRLRQAWDVAETPDAQADVVRELRAALAQ